MECLQSLAPEHECLTANLVVTDGFFHSKHHRRFRIRFCCSSFGAVSDTKRPRSCRENCQLEGESPIISFLTVFHGAILYHSFRRTKSRRYHRKNVVGDVHRRCSLHGHYEYSRPTNFASSHCCNFVTLSKNSCYSPISRFQALHRCLESLLPSATIQ